MKAVIVCRCEEVTKEEILEAIQNGDESLNSIKRRTRAGMGLCQGKTCKKLIANLISSETGQDVASILPGSVRPPARPISLEMLACKRQEVANHDSSKD